MPKLNPFTYGSMLTDPQHFIGRRAELEFITSRLNGEQPQGSSIVGPRRMGKSSLLHYLIHPRDNEALCKAPGQHAVYFDAQKGECSTPDRFRVTLLHLLLTTHAFDPNLPEGRKLAQLQTQLTSETECSWATARSILAALPFHPVVCLDEFEALLTDAFDEQFFNGLRSWANEGLLTWIIVSVKSLPELGQLYNCTSPFFNLLATIELSVLQPQEAEQLLDLAAAHGAAFTAQERAWLLDLTDNHPYHLQILGWRLWRYKAADIKVGERELRQFLAQQLNPPQHLAYHRLARFQYYQKTLLLLLLILLPTLLLVWQNWGLVEFGLNQGWYWLERVGTRLAWFNGVAAGFMTTFGISVALLSAMLGRENLLTKVKTLWAKAP